MRGETRGSEGVEDAGVGTSVGSARRSARRQCGMSRNAAAAEQPARAEAVSKRNNGGGNVVAAAAATTRNASDADAEGDGGDSEVGAARAESMAVRSCAGGELRQPHVANDTAGSPRSLSLSLSSPLRDVADADFALGDGTEERGAETASDLNTLHLADSDERNTRRMTAGAQRGSKLFVGGLSWNTTEVSLRNYFQQFGSVLSCVVIKDRQTGTPRGFGFVQLDSTFAADEAARREHYLDGRVIEAKLARSRNDTRNPDYDFSVALSTATSTSMGEFSDEFSSGTARTNANQAGADTRRRGRATETDTAEYLKRKLFVGGLPVDCTERDLVKHFNQYGAVTHAQIMLDGASGRSRGFAFVTFQCGDHANSALCAPPAQHVIGGKQVDVKPAEPKGGDGRAHGHGSRGNRAATEPDSSSINVRDIGQLGNVQARLHDFSVDDNRQRHSGVQAAGSAPHFVSATRHYQAHLAGFASPGPEHAATGGFEHATQSVPPQFTSGAPVYFPMLPMQHPSMYSAMPPPWNSASYLYGVPPHPYLYSYAVPAYVENVQARPHTHAPQSNEGDMQAASSHTPRDSVMSQPNIPSAPP